MCRDGRECRGAHSVSDGGCYGSAQLAALCGNEGGSAQSAVAATVNRAVCSTHQSLPA